MALICPLCVSSLPFGLTKLQKCNHLGHTVCLLAYVREHGVCPYANCKAPATEGELLHTKTDEEPKPTNFGFENKFVGEKMKEVVALIRHRLVDLRIIADAPDSEFKQMEEHLEKIEAVPNGTDGTETQVKAEQSTKAWDDFIAFLWKASPIILLAFFVLCCWYFTPLASAVGALFEGIPALVMRLASLLQNYVPEIVYSGITIFTSVLGKKKLCN